MSVSGPSPLGTLLVQRVEAALGATLSQQANIATGARPDAVTQPGQPDKVDPAKNPPPKEQEGARRAQDQGGRQAGLAALARNDPELAKLLAARNAPMTGYTASAPTTLGQAAKTILALLQQFPDAKPAVNGRAPLLNQPPGHAGASTPAGAAAQSGAASSGGNLDPRAIQALMQRAGGDASPAGTTSARAAGGSTLASQASTLPGQTAPAGPGGSAAGLSGNALPLPTGMAGQLAAALFQALQGSGLFYESHLRDFTFGQRSLGQILAEPQAQAGRAAGSGNTTAPAGQAHSTAEASSSQTTQTAQTAQSNAQLAGALLGLDPSTHALVRQQLETLSNQAFAWHGEAWPGTELEWEVAAADMRETKSRMCRGAPSMAEWTFSAPRRTVPSMAISSSTEPATSRRLSPIAERSWGSRDLDTCSGSGAAARGSGSPR